MFATEHGRGNHINNVAGVGEGRTRYGNDSPLCADCDGSSIKPRDLNPPWIEVTIIETDKGEDCEQYGPI